MSNNGVVHSDASVCHCSGRVTVCLCNHVKSPDINVNKSSGWRNECVRTEEKV